MKLPIEIDGSALAQFCKRNRIRTLSLFGSVLREDFEAGSDVDMLVEFEPGSVVTLLDMAQMEIELGEMFGRKVDLRTPAELSRYFREKVRATAVVQYAAGEKPSLDCGSLPPLSKGQWPHAPAHLLAESGAYMVTAGTYEKRPHFAAPDRLSFLHDSLLLLAPQYGWQLQAWALFTNHYHFVGISADDAASLRDLMRHLHSTTAREVNRLDKTRGRKVWFQYWDTHVTYQRSYFARLTYVHHNPVRHGIVTEATAYPWCSATWFRHAASPAFFKTVASFKTDSVTVHDDFCLDCGGLPPLSKAGAISRTPKATPSHER